MDIGRITLAAAAAIGPGPFGTHLHKQREHIYS
jgi:hypothetical protein